VVNVGSAVMSYHQSLDFDWCYTRLSASVSLLWGRDFGASSTVVVIVIVIVVVVVVVVVVKRDIPDFRLWL